MAARSVFGGFDSDDLGLDSEPSGSLKGASTAAGLLAGCSSCVSPNSCCPLINIETV
ncbi:hypothetical protein Dimus_008421, partial [Dionaea muscipula]